MAPPGPTPADAAGARTYEPRPASERALAELVAWLDGPAHTAVLAAAPGAGTTYVLHRLERRERERRRVLFSPFVHIAPEDVVPWLAGLAEAASTSLDAWLVPGTDAPPLLLVDEAHAAPLATIDALALLRETRAPHLRICLGGCAGPALAHAAQRVGGANALWLELPPWSEDDLRQLAESLCASRGAPELDPATLVACADGSPEQLRLAGSVLGDRPPSVSVSVLRLAPLPPLEPAEEAATIAPAPEPEPPPARTSPPIALPDASPSRAPRAPAAAPPESPVPVLVSPPAASAAPPLPPPTASAAPRAPAPPERQRAAPPPRERRRVGVPWFHAAALLLGFVIGLVGGWYGWEDRAPEPEVASASEPEPEPPRAAPAAPTAAAAADAPRLAAVSAEPPAAVAAPAALLRHDVQVNARPWAWIRIDGEEVGVTPLVRRGLAGGAHEFEARFPDGRTEQRTIEVGPDSRFVAFPE
jgi:hypothetical protein